MYDVLIADPLASADIKFRTIYATRHLVILFEPSGKGHESGRGLDQLVGGLEGYWAEHCTAFRYIDDLVTTAESDIGENVCTMFANLRYKTFHRRTAGSVTGSPYL